MAQFQTLLFRIFLCTFICSYSGTAFPCGDLLRNIVQDNVFGISNGGVVSPRRRSINRDLLFYESMFGREFESEYRRRGIHYLDLGAGNGVFAQELSQKFMNERNPSKVTALSYEVETNHFLNADGRDFRFLSGRFFEEMPDAVIGRPDVVVDFYGVLAYTDQPSLVLEKLFRLNPNLKIYLALKTGESSLFKTQVLTREDRYVSFPHWLESVSGLSVRYANSQHSAMILEKSGNLDFPNLKLVDLDETTMPPARYFDE